MTDSDLKVTNNEKIDKLTTAVTELQTTLRLYLMLSYVVFPTVIGLLVFLAASSFYSISRIDRLSDGVTELNEVVYKLDRAQTMEPMLAPPAPPTP